MKTTNTDPAFAALKSYDQGSGRAALLPIDEAVQASLRNEAARLQLEQQLLAALKSGGSAVAREYVCSKLALMGSESCVPSLAALLDDSQAATAARNALEKLPGRKASKALRESLPRLSGAQKIGVIASLGARRDEDSVPALASLLADSNHDWAAAAAAALGDIGSLRAAKALAGFQPRAPASIRCQVADAVLACAERLVAAGDKRQARVLYQALDAPAQPAHVRNAARQGLKQSG